MTAGARPLSRDAAIVGGMVVLLALPQLLLGPQMTADDWVWVRNGEFLGWWDAGGTRQVGRPGAFVLYALVFGLGGPHPMVHALVQVVLWGAAAVAVLAALREVVEHGVALLVTVVWLVLPGHTTLELWASTSQAWVAVALLALGARQVARWSRQDGALWPALVCLGLAGAFYEVALVAAPAVALLVDRQIRGRWRWRVGLLAGGASLPAAAWSLAHASVYGDTVDTTQRFWIEHLGGALSLGLGDFDRPAAAIVLVASLAAVALAWRVEPPSGTVPGRHLALAGLLLVLVGVLPALRSYTVPFGMGNRLTAVSGIGAVLLWTGAALAVRENVSSWLHRAAAVAVVLMSLAVRADHVVEWNRVGDEGARAARELGSRARDAGGVLVTDEPVAVGDLFYGLYDGWNATAAAQVTTRDPTVVVQVDVGCIRSGPRADEPLEQYGRRPELVVPRCEERP